MPGQQKGCRQTHRAATDNQNRHRSHHHPPLSFPDPILGKEIGRSRLPALRPPGQRAGCRQPLRAQDAASPPLALSECTCLSLIANGWHALSPGPVSP